MFSKKHWHLDKTCKFIVQVVENIHIILVKKLITTNEVIRKKISCVD